MTSHVIVDTGPLVAFLNKRDTWHGWAVEQLSHIEGSLSTCEAVLSEAAFLLRADHRGADALLDLIERELLVLPFRLDDDAWQVRKLMKRYANVPMSLADACLVRMSEADQRASVLTLDKDFKIYRRLGRQVIPQIAPKA